MHKNKNLPIKSRDIKVSSRVVFQLSSESMPSIYEALVEYITNVDDSYERLAIEKKERSAMAAKYAEFIDCKSSRIC